MKKKEFLTPDIQVVEMELSNMICFSASGEVPGGGDEIPGEGPDE